MIESKDVERLCSADYIWYGFIVPRPLSGPLPSMGKWAIVFSTNDGLQYMCNQRQRIYLFGSLDMAAQFLAKRVGQDEVITQLEFDHDDVD